MLIVNARRVEHLTPMSMSMASARDEENLDASIHGPDGKPAVPLHDKLFRMSGETGSYKCADGGGAKGACLAKLLLRLTVA